MREETRLRPTHPPRIPIEAIRARPDGIVEVIELPGRRVLVQKSGSEIQLLFDSTESCEIQSRLDLERPLDLVSTYTRALLLGLLWRCPPKRVHVLGLGGGRIPMILRHHFPEARIDCSEIEPAVTELAVRWFGLEIDERLRVSHEDGIAFLERQPGQPRELGPESDPEPDPKPGSEPEPGSDGGPYDLILVDAFSGLGRTEERFASAEFLRLCRRRVRSEGLVALNLLPGDPGLAANVAGFRSAFREAWLYRDEEAMVAFGHDGPTVPRDELMRRARELKRQVHLDFLPGTARRLESADPAAK
jgi:spermidine synthase